MRVPKRDPGNADANDLSTTGVIQCVGFARYWLEINQGVTFPQVDNAFDIWESINSYRRVIDGVMLKVINRINGCRYLPQLGDLIIYHQGFYGTGHVAVVQEVDETAKTIHVVEQNYMGRNRLPDQQRLISFSTSGRGYCLQEQHILGWKHLTRTGEMI